jgi:hypothetical protein
VSALLSGGAFAAPEGLVDPTRPASATAIPATLTDASGIRVQAVFIRADSSVAIVNGRLVKAGDHIAGVSIEAVTAAGVRYTQAGHPGFATVHETRLDVRTTAPNKKDVP